MTNQKSFHPPFSTHNSDLLAYEKSHVLLEAYSIPVVQSLLAASPRKAAIVANQIGFPVVLKGLGPSLLHKTEAGAVRQNLPDGDAVKIAARRMIADCGDRLEKFVVQPQIRAQRELVVGLIRDAQFGAVIMFGAGGILTEVLDDVTFRLAPLREQDAISMVAEIKSRKVLGSFRGESAVSRRQLIEILMGLSRLADEHPEITEIDINPLMITPQGDLIAADILVLTDKKNTRNSARTAGHSPHVSSAALLRFLHPRSIAFIGASAQFGKWGHFLVAHTLGGGYTGDVYLVNPKGGSIFGQKVHRAIRDIPGDVDLAVVTIPAEKVLALLPELSAKKISRMLLISSGFSESGDHGRSLETALVRKARQAEILFIGPNTMGISNPHIKFFCTGSPVPTQKGTTVILSQSGNMGTQLLAFAKEQGIGIRGFVGSGNESMISTEDYLEGFENDALTRTIIIYVESLKNSRRFFNSARRISKKKPIIMLKGGISAPGKRAAASHTGAMASNERIFRAACRQSGIIRVNHTTDLLDLAAAFSALPLPKGDRVAIMTFGGGWGVVTADLCAACGLKVPQLPPKLIKRLDQLLPTYWSRANPVDIVGQGEWSAAMIIIEELMKWDGCSGVINLGILGRDILIKEMSKAIKKTDPEFPESTLRAAMNLTQKDQTKFVEHITALMETYQKPIFGVSFLSDTKDCAIHKVPDKRYKGLFYNTPEHAVKAFAKMAQYQHFLRYEAHK